MPFVTTLELLNNAQKDGYAIGAFNAENMEMVQAIISAAEEMEAPVIVQTTAGTLKYAPPRCYAGMVSRLAAAAKVPVALHLDHGNSFELAQECLNEGYTSIMIDGSLLAYEDNILLAQRVVEIAGPVPVEAELGNIGGKEDGQEAHAQYTNPQQAADFAERTGISSLAIAIGTAHGIYKGIPKLELDVLSKIRRLVDIPLVLHGTSGIPHDVVRECIKRGMCKVNYATELRIAFTEAVKKAMIEFPDAFDPKKYLGSGREAVRKLVCERISLCQSNGKA